VTDGPAIDAALELAAAVGANGPLAVKASKQVIVESRLWPDDQMWKKQQEIVARVFTSEDAREGAAAFAEKRAELEGQVSIGCFTNNAPVLMESEPARLSASLPVSVPFETLLGE
jgi:hypothetical protein